jgi:hypothetical protein
MLTDSEKIFLQAREKIFRPGPTNADRPLEPARERRYMELTRPESRVMHPGSQGKSVPTFKRERELTKELVLAKDSKSGHEEVIVALK